MAEAIDSFAVDMTTVTTTPITINISPFMSTLLLHSTYLDVHMIFDIPNQDIFGGFVKMHNINRPPTY